MKRDIELEATLVAKYAAVGPVLDERSRRRWAAAESLAIGLRRRRGGFVGHRCGSGDDSARGAGRVPATRRRRTAFDALAADGPASSRINPASRPRSKRWVDPLTRRRPDLAAALDVQESREAGGGADRAGVAGEFDHCGPAAAPPGLPAAIAAQNGRKAPRIRTATRSSSTSTRPRTSIWPPASRWSRSTRRRKELVGNFKNGGREWQPKGTPPAVLVHDFPTDAEGKAIPYGVYDMARNEAWVSVGWDHDTPAFAVASIRHWWHQMGCGAYPEATTLFITADAGGSNGYRLRAWKHELQQLADETGLTIEVSHFPPGTSKWNKIEHRLFCHITANWRGTPLTTYETIVDRIGNVRTATGLRVRAELDAGEYPTGVTVTKEQMDALALVPDAFHGKWNYKLLPR